MRIGFVIERKNYYRGFGPVVDRALARGWQTECWHDVSQPRSGPKALEFPDPGAVPSFRHGRPTVRTYRGEADLARQLRADPSDAMVALRCGAVGATVGAVRWFGLQDTLNCAPLIHPNSDTQYHTPAAHSALRTSP